VKNRMREFCTSGTVRGEGGNVLTYSAEEMHEARPKRLRFLLLNTVGKVVRHARETLLRCADALARALADAPRVAFRLLRPALAGE